MYCYSPNSLGNQRFSLSLSFGRHRTAIKNDWLLITALVSKLHLCFEYEHVILNNIDCLIGVRYSKTESTTPRSVVNDIYHVVHTQCLLNQRAA